MGLSNKNMNEAPIYRRIVERFSRDISSGALADGSRLPTVRALSLETGASPGTVKHAYDTLEQLGLIEKHQGRGSFVRNLNSLKTAGRKELALKSIDKLLDEMLALGFSMWDTRIFLDLKLREREQLVGNVRVGAVDCSIEALSVMYRQIATLPNVDAYEYLLQPILDAPSEFASDMDILVTTPTHFEDLAAKLPPDSSLLRIVMALSGETMLELARIPTDAKVGVICVSERFAGIILKALQQCCELKTPPKVAYFGDTQGVRKLAAKSGRLIFPPNYLRFASPEERSVLSEHAKENPPVIYGYQVERGSLLFLEEEVGRVFENKSKRL